MDKLLMLFVAFVNTVLALVPEALTPAIEAFADQVKDLVIDTIRNLEDRILQLEKEITGWEARANSFTDQYVDMEKSRDWWMEKHEECKQSTERYYDNWKHAEAELTEVKEDANAWSSKYYDRDEEVEKLSSSRDLLHELLTIYMVNGELYTLFATMKAHCYPLAKQVRIYKDWWENQYGTTMSLTTASAHVKEYWEIAEVMDEPVMPEPTYTPSYLLQ